MDETTIHVIGYEELVILAGLLGIKGTVLQESNSFMKVFNELIKDTSISIIIVSMALSEDIIKNLTDFKLNNKKPFVIIVPDVFLPNVDSEEVILKKILESTKKILV